MTNMKAMANMKKIDDRFTIGMAPLSADDLRELAQADYKSAVKTLPGPAFVHCASGKRAGALTVMHLAAENGMSGDATLKQAEAMGFACDEPALKRFVRDYVDGQSG